MGTEPRAGNRPADVIGNAVHVVKVLIGEADDAAPDDGKDPAAKALGAKGGKARASKLTPLERRSIAQKAARSRWGDR